MTDVQSVEQATLYRVHSEGGQFDRVSEWFRTREEAEAYPDDEWRDGDISVEARKAAIIGGDVFVASDLGLCDREAA